ncbi:unnamed protein product [Echinostoma caproni]|uniref:Peptidase M60 domain-containing protein n=1 Tax=Echinostoma caproni TaxID=27848 RepID=A0A183ASB8_9TREM|nr:unnamed protein product [Echinostoma caproni]
MIARGSPDGTEIVKGQTVSEVGIWGNRIGDKQITPEPEWGEEDRYMVGEKRPVRDVVLGSGHGHIMGMAVTRGKGRAVAMIGERWMRELFTAPYLANFSVNLKNFLGQGDHPEFRWANEDYKPGDIVLVKRSMHFNVTKLAKAVMEGVNGVVISYLGTLGTLGQHNTLDLMRALNIQIYYSIYGYVQDAKVDLTSLIYSASAYVNPGEVFKWRVKNSTDKVDKFFFTFSCQSDDISKVNPWKRWPVIKHALQLRSEGSYATPTGGILLMRIDADNIGITLELEDVYRHPWFDLRNQSAIDDWDNERLRHNLVPWTMFFGDIVFSCLQTKAVVKLNKDDMVFLQTYMDNVVKIMHNFRGSDWTTAGIEVFAVDIQIAAGWGHSGMPVLGHLPWQDSSTDIKDIKKTSNIGITHEFGHNLQNWAATLKWGTEVTNNVYHFIVRGHLVNLTAYGFNVSWAFGWHEVKQVIDIWKGTDYNGVNLGYYNWLGMLFGEGLLVNLWHETFHNRNSLNSEEKKVNFWLTKMCSETEHNVIPWQELWNFPIDNNTRTECAKYSCYFPDDALTQQVPDIVEKAISKVPGGCVRTPKKQVASKHDIFKGLYTHGQPWFSFL